MEPILSAHQTLEHKSNLSKTLTDVQLLIDQLQQTRDAVASSPELAATHMAKLKTPVKHAFERIEEDLKEVNKGLNGYQKALREKFKGTLPGAGGGGGGAEGGNGGGGGSGGGLEDDMGLVNRAVAMHLLREGKFGVAETFIREVNENPEGDAEKHAGKQSSWGEEMWRREFSNINNNSGKDENEEAAAMDDDDDDDVKRTPPTANAPIGNGNLQTKFTEMYTILDALRNQHDLQPAIAWARANTAELENRGSNLEFELARLKFVELYTSTSSHHHPENPNTEDESANFTGPLLALHYARQTFPHFTPRYTRRISTLLGSLAFSTNLPQSPYTTLFHVSGLQDHYLHVAETFTREFCSMLGLSQTSPLYTAVTAGGISLPILSKLEKILTTSRGQWTSVNELPVETPLPPGMLYHSIFVCPVSKEQATDANPPMMLPCGHVIAKESLEMHARGKSRMKCPYCPGESVAREARRVYI